MRRLCFVVGALLVLPACAKGTSGGNPFGTLDSGMTPMEDEEDESDTEEDDSATMTSGISGGDSSTGDSDPSTTSGGDSSTSTPVVSDGTSSSGGLADESSSSTGMPPDGSQPAMGMYAHCYDMFFDNCTAPSTICVNITGEMEGFCTADGCLSPAVDCDPAPGGTAAPFCLSAGGYSVCALDCSSGESCAAGMECRTVSFDGVVDYDLCM